MLNRFLSLLTVVLILLVQLFFKCIPTRVCWSIGELLGSLAYCVLPKRRRIVRKNLEIVAKASPSFDSSKKLIKKVFRRSFANLTCSVKTYGMSFNSLEKLLTVKIDLEAQKVLNNPHSGAIICLAHMGNWEVLSKIGHKLFPSETPYGAIYRPLDLDVADEYIVRERQRNGCEMFTKKAGISKYSQFIKNGGVLGVLADQRSSNKKNSLPFFEKLTPRAKLPAVLADRTGAPLLGIKVYSKKPATWNIHVFKISSQDSPDEPLQSITESYERIFLEHIEDVFWLHTYWK